MALPVLPPPNPFETCKVCNTSAPWLGNCDFSKFCSHEWQKAPRTGVNVDYYRCPNCGFVFTSSFDHFTPKDWSEHIYNEGYEAVDPDYKGPRARSFAQGTANTFRGAESIRVLDYGGGMGYFAQAMAGHGWKDVKTYDPFVPQFATRPTGIADLITCTEVLEHSPDPIGTFQEMVSFTHESSVIIATTLLVPMDANASILDFWYIAPRNGHVSIHSQKSLSFLASRWGFRMISFSPGTHGFWRQKPPWAAHIFPE